ncbi:uncharacterized protein [Parasteatoda tepidariorum]|uniref:uncharacterized protein n=1 Tax=Parasteatoda tepidariorum TaxID=114398 RepID=UPI00077F83B0|nr:histidine-rich glycoprotein-like [Parasteatoda tepidariorum]
MMKLILVVLLSWIAYVTCQYDLSHHHDHGGHDYLESEHGEKGHGHLQAYEVTDDQAHKKHGHHEVAAHKAYGDKVAHHDSHHKDHDKGYYERNKGKGYVKAYEYDHIKTHHDKGSSHDAHDYHHDHYGKEGSHKHADYLDEGHDKYAKKSYDSGHGYDKYGKSLGKHGGYHHSYDSRGHHVPLPILSHHSYKPGVKVVYSPVYAGPEHLSYSH